MYCKKEENNSDTDSTTAIAAKKEEERSIKANGWILVTRNEYSIDANNKRQVLSVRFVVVSFFVLFSSNKTIAYQQRLNESSSSYVYPF